MKFVERFLFCLAFIGLMLRIFTNDNGVTMAIPMAALVAWYALFTFFITHDISFGEIFKKERYAFLRKRDVFYGLVAGLVFGALVLAILFRMVILANSEIMINYGSVLALAFALVSAFIYSKDKRTANKYICTRAVILLVVILVIRIAEFWLDRP